MSASAASAYYRGYYQQQHQQYQQAMTIQMPPSTEMMEKHHALSFLGRRPMAPRPLSQATEFLDTDDEEDDSLEESDPTNSTPRSLESMDDGSLRTASSNGPPSPPPTGGLGGFEFHFDEKPVPTPPIFQSMTDMMQEMSISNAVELFQAEPPSAYKESVLEMSRPLILETPRSPVTRTFSALPQAVSELDEAQVRAWTPRQVASWMREAGFEDSLVAKFLHHDISGNVLLDLQHGDLKELDITFRSRNQVMSSIQHLRNSSIESPSRDRQSRALRRDVQPQEAKLLVYQVEDGMRSTSRNRSTTPSRRRRQNVEDIISPAESVSIVAIEQLLPKPHKCSKGEDCPKWRKQQKKLKRYQEEFDRYNEEIGDPANDPISSHTELRPKSEAEPSVVASSDVLGPQLEFTITAQKLREVLPRDPQESVRQFLSFQHLHTMSSSSDPSPPPASSASFRPTSPPRAQKPAALTEQLRTLPKLTIPPEPLNNDNQPPSSRTPISALRGPNYYGGVQGHLLAQLQKDPYHYGGVASPADIYRHGTPASVTDLPLATYPADILSRDVSQSVPPDMRFGSDNHQITVDSPADHTPIFRPASTQPESTIIPPPPPPPQMPSNLRRSGSTRRRPSFAPTVAPVTESPTTPKAPTRVSVPPPPTHPALPQRLEDVYHAGWMRKRKTTPLLRRHEWIDNYFRLHGTHLTSHDSSDPAAKRIELIDVEEYAIACQTLASSSKLSAAFKKSILGSNYKDKLELDNGHAFAFSLIPDSDKTKKVFNSGKASHHFAVHTRDERIEWMRDLMLAKALKRAGAEKGNEVKVTGNMI